MGGRIALKRLREGSGIPDILVFSINKEYGIQEGNNRGNY